MTILTPTPDLIAAARRVRDARVESRYNEPPAKDPHVLLLHQARLVRWVQVAPIPDARGRIPTDRWAITDAGREWLDEHDKEVAR